MRDFIKREAKQTVTIREVPERIVKELDAIWERLGFEDTQVKVNDYKFQFSFVRV